MVQGMLDVSRESPPAPKEQQIYNILFHALGEHGAVKHQKSICGEESLREYFIDLQSQTMSLERRSLVATEWMLTLQKNRSLSLGLICITDQQFEDFSKVVNRAVQRIAYGPEAKD